jgi:PAS domain S-box-containing protein
MNNLNGNPNPGQLTTSVALSQADGVDVSFFANCFHDSPVPSLILAPNSTVLFWNAAAERMFGWSAEEVLGRPLPIVPQARMDEHQWIRQHTLDGQSLWQHRLTRLTKGGTPIELILSTWPIRGADGRVIAIIGVYADVGTEAQRFRQSLAEKQLEEIERLYATAPIGLCFLDTELRFVRVNERLAQIDGLAANAHIGRRLADVAPEVAASLEGIYREVIKTGVPLTERELRASTPALPGVQRDWLVSAYPLKHPDGTVLGITVAVGDITERKRLNEALKCQETLLRLVIDAMPGVVVYVDREYRFRFANRTYREWFQCNPVGHELADVHGEATFEQLRDDLDRALAGEQMEFEKNIRYHDRQRDVHLHYLPDRGPDGVVHGVVALVQDVTKQKRVARAQRDTEERLRRVLEIAAEGIWIVDTAGKTSFVNDRMATILGYRKEEMLGRLYMDFMAPEDHHRARREFESCENLNPGPQEYRLRHKDGNIVWANITQTPMLDDNKTCTGVMVICTDVTERKRSEQRLRQAQKLESLGLLAGGVAHDFNNLLTSIMGNASLALETTDPGSRPRGMLQNVITASERAAQLTRQLLTYAGKDQGKLKPLDIAAAAGELVPLLSASIPKMVRLSLELEDGVPLVEADPGQLQQVMMNLVINAAESIPERTVGAVKVAVGRRSLQPEDYRDAVVPIERGNREYVSFTVSDNGRGMDATTQARIFDPFFSTKFHGRGLGLSAVLGIVKGHGGTLTVQTALEKGSIFTVLLPASQFAQQAETPVRAMPEKGRTGTGTILFVDDEPGLRTIAQSALEEHGYGVLLAENGQEAIAVLKKHPEVRAVVVDLAMPVMSGDTAVPIMRSLRPEIPMILSSGYSESGALERLGANVVEEFLEKPYRPGMLVAKVDEVLREYRPAPSSGGDRKEGVKQHVA